MARLETEYPSATSLRFPSHVYAHSLSARPLEEWQRLAEHLLNVAGSASKYATDFDSADWGWNAGLMHDIGKAADPFQAYLRRENHLDDEHYDLAEPGKINHSSAGASLAEECVGLLGRALAYIVAGHHAGLPDFHSCDGGMGALTERLKEGRTDLESIRESVTEIQTALHPLSQFPRFVKHHNFHFWVRMVFSCLVDADFLDTEAFMRADRSRQRIESAGLSKLKSALDRHMGKISAGCDDSLVNRTRAEILAACRVAAQNKSGLFSLTVPTGGGKTLAAMSFALDHAVLHGKKRVVYVIPYTSILEQTAEILAGIFGRENVVEHHSNLAPEKETLRNQLASENWDAPVVVTTNVQFFESLYAARPSRCRKLHNLVDCVVILDEAQLVPPNLLAPCVAAINELTLNYGTTLVLSTATQPALPGLVSPTDIIPSNLDLYGRLRRTEIEIPADLKDRIDWEHLAADLTEHQQVLCIVNTRRDCYELYRAMPEGTIHLSATLCGEHRSSVIGSIKKRLMEGTPIRVVSTQLVEAGVDIDFPVVYRALAGLDSIAQAAGRCNREGKLERPGRVVVFVPPKSAPAGLLHKGESTTRELTTLTGFDSQSPDWFTRYFDSFYPKVNDTGKQFLKDLTPSDPGTLDVAFRSVAEKFHLIDDRNQQTIIVLHGESGKWIEKLRYAGPTREIMRRLQRYTVNVAKRLAAEMLSCGRLEMLDSGIVVQTLPNDYRDDVGLNIFGDELPVQDLIS